MKQAENHHFLDQPISLSPLSVEFKAVTETLGFFTFNDLLQHRTVQFERFPGFTQNLVYEYVDFLETNHLGHLIDP